MRKVWRLLVVVARIIFFSCMIAILPGTNMMAAADANTESKAIYGDHTMYQDVVACDIGAKNTNVPAALTGLRDQIAQMLNPLVTSEEMANDAVGTHHVGGFFVNTPFFDGAKINSAKSKFSPTPFVGLDQEGGQVDRLKLGLPSAKAMGGMSTDQVKQLGSQTADKIKEIGGTFDAAPVLDIDSPNSPAIGNIQRAFSNNPDVIAEKAGAYAEGLKASGMTPVFKHFPGIGRTTVNSDQVAGSTPSLDELKSLDLKPYEKLLANNTTGAWVMMANYDVPGLTNGVPATKSKAAYDLLRNDYKFNGIIITDDLAAGALGGPGALPDSVLESIKSGADVALFTGEDQLKAIIDKVEAAANADPALKTQIEASSAKLTAAKAGQGDAKAGDGKGCSCGGSATILNGSNFEEKVWNYLAGKGFTTVQAAGVMGNLKIESGGNFDPQQLEIAYSDAPHRWTEPLALPPVRGPQGQPGLGIIQWTTPDRKQKLLDFAKQQPANSIIDLGVQLDFMWKELNDSYKSAALDPILKSSDLAEVVHLWQDHYEVGVGYEPRFEAAKTFLGKYGSGTPSGGGQSGGASAGGGCSTGGQQGPTGGTFSWPEKTQNSYITQCFGGPNGHPGIDISNSGPPSETPIFASADGEVVMAGPASGYGPNFVVIKHASIKFGTSYGHMNKMLVKTGDQVKQGQQIGEQGSLGISTGPHLHFNVFPGDYSGWDHANVDPFKNGLSVPPGVSNPNNCGG